MNKLLQTALPSLVASAADVSLSLPFDHHRRRVPVQHIVRLEGDLNYTRCFFRNGTSLLVAITLKALLERLPEGRLVRVHRKHALNPDFVAEWNPYEGFVRLQTGERFPIARRRNDLKRPCCLGI
jgi:DNA-binding LytR/AlgR family response regulator